MSIGPTTTFLRRWLGWWRWVDLAKKCNKEHPGLSVTSGWGCKEWVGSLAVVTSGETAAQARRAAAARAGALDPQIKRVWPCVLQPDCKGCRCRSGSDAGHGRFQMVLRAQARVSLLLITPIRYSLMGARWPGEWTSQAGGCRTRDGALDQHSPAADQAGVGSGLRAARTYL
jgi:hypothetical protein